MAESAVSFLLDQLSVFLREEGQLLGGLEREVKYIQGELRQMNELLRVAVEKEESNPGLKEWITQLREISYDVEDVLDKYMLRFGRHRSRGGLGGCIRKVFASIKNLKARHQISSEIQAIKYSLENASKSQQKYRDMYAAFMDQGSSSTIPKNEFYDGRGDALFLEEDDVVGFQEPKEQLLKWIWSVDNGLEVISVVGMGGLGKTTLVKKVYDDESVKKHFDRHVWIVASDYTDVKHLLVNLIKKLVGEIKDSPPQELEHLTIDDMRNFIYEFLKGKSYIIVLDDVWDMPRWEAIRVALPKRGGHGCIIITTRHGSIAESACSETDHVYNLKPLSEQESEVLFYRKAFPRNPCPPNYLKEIAENILNRCEGLPLAIVVIGGLLATKNNRVEEWERFNRSLLREIEGGSRLWKLLSLSYNDLPYYLKYCYLYLSIFPEGHLLEKETIIRLWTTEGFVQSKQDEIVEEVAEDYLNELSSRSLIQVAEKKSDGTTKVFRIHDLLREYMTSKSREQNVVTIYNGGGMQWPNKIRCLAIKKSTNFSLETNNIKHLRSLLQLCDGNLMCGLIEELLTACRLLKVLELRGAPLETIPNEVFKLYHLKYLCLRNTMVKLIPKSIKYLQNLETLDLKNSNVTELPIEILKLHKLRHLLVYKYNTMSLANYFEVIRGFKAPYDIGNWLLSLQKLCVIDADAVGSIKIVKEIGKLTQLRRLGITKLRSEDGKDLCSSIEKLTNLRSLSIVSVDESEKLDLDYPLSCASLPFLRTLVMVGCLEKVPQWIPSLNGLTTLHLISSKLRDDLLSCLHYLPNLAHLKIIAAYVEGLSFKAQGFQKLKELWLLDLKCLKWVIVEKGSMPFLQDWIMRDCKLLTELPRGMEHLTNLQLVEFQNMANEFVERVAQEKRNEGDNWRLASVPNVGFFNKTDDDIWNELQVL